jgi:dephospho-CoA kinase
VAARVVGLTGGIGSGKSEALAAFGRHGAATFSSDDAVRLLYDRGGVRTAVAERFGPGVVREDGSIDRARVAERVFANPAARGWLEALLLPLLAAEFEAWRDRAVGSGANLLVHEAPTLFEAGIEDRYDTIVTVTAPRELREQRRPGSAGRMASQLPEEDKAARSDVVYENTGTLDDLDRFVAELVRRLETD